MSIYEYNEEEHIRMEREEAFEDGVKEGLERSREQLETAEQRVSVAEKRADMAEKRADTAEKRAESAEAELRKLMEQLNGKNE